MPKHRPSSCVVLWACVCALAGALGGCAGASLTGQTASLEDLAARQRLYASSHAEPDVWAELAADFERLATAPGLPRETRERARFGV
ncbi:hypothetical protein HOK31_26825, partial [Candidatus Poribacteria bacterium]|nr:hypothetical protein [Candidatus Poribacteria bacterium]